MPGTYQYDVEIKSNVAKLLSDMKQVQDRLDTVEGKEYKIKLNVDEKKLSSVISNLEKMLDSLGKGTGDFKQFENLSKELSSIVSEVQNLSKAFGKVDDSGAKTLLSSIQNIDKSLSELSQNIRNVNKNMSNMGGNTSGAVKQVENISNAYQDAVKEAEKLADAQSKIGQKTNISSDISSQVKVSDSITDQIVANEKKKQEAYKATTETVMYHAGVISKLNKAETNGRFYGSDRGTGYFGTGHYFVDSNTKHELDNNSSYSSLPYTSIDISKYDNLFKATSDEVADALHTFLKNLTKFTQGSDSFEVSELFSQFQKVFGETTMDMQEFDAKLSQLKAYMQSSNMSDRGDSVSTQFMKSLGYGGVDTRGTKYADTRYGTVIYDLKEESVLQANITDELQKQGQMLEKINYEKGQVFDKSEDTRIQGILDQQAKTKEIETEFNKIFDSTNLNAYESELDSVNQKLTENESIINNCKSAIETADEDAKRFAKEMAEFDLHMSDEEIAETANKNKVEYQERIEELSKEQSLLKDRKQEIESNLDAEYKLANAARERATATVEDRMKDAFTNADTKLYEAVTSAKDLDKTLEQVDIPTDSFDAVLKKLDLAKSELIDIVKITKQSVSDSEGKFHTSYTLKDSRGSSEIYGESSKTDKGQLLRSNIVRYDKKKDEVDISKELLEVDKQLAKEEDELAKTQQKKAQAFQKEQTNYENEQKKVEYVKQNRIAYEELTNTIKSYSEIAKRVASGNAEDGDLELMTKLEDKISQLQKQPILSDSQVLKSEKSLVSLYDQLDKIERKLVETNQKSQDKQIAGFDKRLESYTKKTSGYDATIARFKDGGLASETYLKNVREVENAVKKYEDLLNDIKAKGGIASEEDIQKLKEYEGKIKETISTVQNMSAAEKGYNAVSGQKELDKIHKILNENTKMSAKAKAQIKAFYKEIEEGNPSMSLDKIHAEIMKIYNAEVEAGRAGRSFFDTLKNSGFHQIAAQMAGMFGVYDVINVIKQAASTVTELNTQITELAKVSEQSSKQIYADFDSYADIAKEVRGTISDTIAATADWSKNGYSIPDAKQLAEVSQLYKNVGDGIDIDTANESLISTLKGFQLEADQAEHIVDVFNEVSKNIGEVA